MKCKNCSGELVFEKGIWVCANCGGHFSIPAGFDDIEVFICYKETDESGRRTKDSFVAQEVYHFLENEKIKSFYGKESAEDYSGQDAQMIEKTALYNSKVVLLVASSTKQFLELWNKNSEMFDGKKVIPIYHSMDAKDIPQEMNSLQALNYERVGATKDLVSGVLRSLGRQKEDEKNYRELSEEVQNKRKVFIVLAAVVGIVLLSIVVGIIISNKNKKEPIKEETGIIEESETTTDIGDIEEKTVDEKTKYEKAVKHSNNGEYSEAIVLFTELGDYNDSLSLLQICYAKYAGYYYDDEKGIFLQFQYYDNNGNVELYAINDEGERCTVSETISFDGNVSDFAYNDSEGNHGTGKIVLENDGIVLSLITSEIKSEVFIPETEVRFSLQDKKDQPITNEVSSEFLKEILNNKTTIVDLRRRGYEVSFIRELYDNKTILLYSFDNADVFLAASAFEGERLYDEDNYIDAEKATNKEDGSLITENDLVIMGVQGPASIVIPEKVGEMGYCFAEGEDLIYPNCELNSHGFQMEFTFVYTPYGEKYIKPIKNDTSVCMCSKASVGDKLFKIMFEDIDSYNSMDDDIYAYSDSDYSFDTSVDTGEFDVVLVSEPGYDRCVESVTFDGNVIRIVGTVFEINTGYIYERAEWIFTESTKVSYYNTEFDIYLDISKEEFEKMCVPNSFKTINAVVHGGIIDSIRIY